MTAAAAGSSLFTGNHIREFFARRLAWHTARRATVPWYQIGMRRSRDMHTP